MADPWQPEVIVGLATLQHLLATQFPEVAGLPAREIGRGWDNAAFLLGDSLVFRLPTRQAGADLVQNEREVLRFISTRLPLAVPGPRFLGKPGGNYPFPFTGFNLVPGSPMTGNIGPGNAFRLGRFLSALHQLPPGVLPPCVPPDLIRRSDLPYRLEKAVALLATSGEPQAADIREDLDRLATAGAWHQAPVLVHGDLYSQHVLLHQGQVSGVIDWGDCHLGDPALDLSIAFSALDGQDRASFFEGYGHVDGQTLERAQFRAVTYGLLLSHYGKASGREDMFEAGQRAIRLTRRTGGP